MVLTAPQRWIRCQVPFRPRAVRTGCEGTDCGLPAVGLWGRLAFSDPLPTSFIFVTVQVAARFLPTSVLTYCGLRSCTCLFLSTVWTGCKRTFFCLAWTRIVLAFGLFGSVANELHFCLCASQVAPRFLPTYVLTKRLPLCVCAYVLGLLSFPLGVPKGFRV